MTFMTDMVRTDQAFQEGILWHVDGPSRQPALIQLQQPLVTLQNSQVLPLLAEPCNTHQCKLSMHD